MPKIRGSMFIVVLSLVLFAAGTMPRTATAQKVDKSTPSSKRAHELAEKHVKELLFLMDTNKNGKVSKQEYMSFMEAEFDRLDKDKSGELDPKELLQSEILLTRPPAAVGK